jgi:hypothetical protein
MGYLNNVSTVLDAILTKKGRELLARGQTAAGSPAFHVTKFALGDDEVDYSLWNVAHPDGTDYYGTVIEALPLLEPTTDLNTVMRYKLTTRTQVTDRMSIITFPNTTINLTSNTSTGVQTGQFAPQTLQLDSGTDDTESYTFTILNASVAFLTNESGETGNALIPYSDTTFTDNITQTVTGASFTLTPKLLASAPTGTSTAGDGTDYDPDNTPLIGTDSPTTIVLITGMDSGATYSVNVKVGWVNV